MTTRSRFLCLVGLAVLASGCLMAGNYHSAKPIGDGNSSFGLTFSAATYEFEDSDGDTERIALPNIIPEMTYHIGIADQLDVGGRVGIGSLALEGDIKYRFFKSDRLHLAVAPAIAYQSLIAISGQTLRLPGIMTYDLSDKVGFTASIFGATTHYSAVDPDEEDDDDLGIFSGTRVASGFSVGFEIRGATMQIRPALEFTQYLVNFDDGDSSSEDSFNTVNLTVHIAFIGGQEKQQLNRIEDKLDRMAPPPPPPPI